MPQDEDRAASGAPPSLSQRAWNSLSSTEFWRSVATLDFWEQGCLGRSIATGSIVGVLAGAHRYRNTKSVLRSAERFGLGFLFGLSINYFSCRKMMDDITRKQRAIQWKSTKADS